MIRNPSHSSAHIVCGWLSPIELWDEYAAEMGLIVPNTISTPLTSISSIVRCVCKKNIQPNMNEHCSGWWVGHKNLPTYLPTNVLEWFNFKHMHREHTHRHRHRTGSRPFLFAFLYLYILTNSFCLVNIYKIKVCDTSYFIYVWIEWKMCAPWAVEHTRNSRCLRCACVCVSLCELTLFVLSHRCFA